jgi:uncharacterized protein
MGSPVVHFEIVGDGTDPGPIADFYTTLFGWTGLSFPGLPTFIGLDTMSAQGIGGGVIAMEGFNAVLFYVEVPDLQATLDQADAAGGTTFMPIREVVAGQLAIAQIADPQGNVLGIVTPGGAQAERKDAGGRHPVVHWEILASDGPAAIQFWTSLFGWQAQDVPMHGYSMIQAESPGIGGGIGQSPDGANLVTFYVQVPDLQAALDRAEALGGSTVMPVTDVTGGPAIARFADPKGNVVGLVG